MFEKMLMVMLVLMLVLMVIIDIVCIVRWVVDELSEWRKWR